MSSEQDTTPDNAQDLTIFVQNLLEQMQQRFSQLSNSIIGRIDEMGNRIDELEVTRISDTHISLSFCHKCTLLTITFLSIFNIFMLLATCLSTPNPLFVPFLRAQLLTSCSRPVSNRKIKLTSNSITVDGNCLGVFP